MTINPMRLDDAARAGWLYYVAGNTQDDIARKLSVSRQTAQRLVSLAVREGLVKVRIDHPIANCLDLAERLKARFALQIVEVVPSDPGSVSGTVGIAEAIAAELERRLSAAEPVTIAMGTGRTLKAGIEKLPTMDCPQHKVVSLTGSIAPDGSAALYNVIFTMADKVKCRAFPMPLPVIASTTIERDLLHRQKLIETTLKLSAEADVTFVGIGDLSAQAPLVADGFITEAERLGLIEAGAVAEIVGWAIDREGRFLDGLTNERVASARLPRPQGKLVFAVAQGPLKLPGIAAALAGGLVNCLITDENTAAGLLKR